MCFCLMQNYFNFQLDNVEEADAIATSTPKKSVMVESLHSFGNIFYYFCALLSMLKSL